MKPDQQPPNPVLSESRARIYEDEEVAITKWSLKPGQHMYQVMAKDAAMQRSGNGYLLLSANAMQRMCQGLSEIIW